MIPANSTSRAPAAPPSETPRKRLNVFERYLTLWVALCMIGGVLLGKLLPGLVGAPRGLEFGTRSQINLPIAVLIWLMIYPMMLKIDFSSIVRVGQRPRGLVVTLVVNWLVKPFSMAFFGWLFFNHIFLPLIGRELASQYIAGVIILAAAAPQMPRPSGMRVCGEGLPRNGPSTSSLPSSR